MLPSGARAAATAGRTGLMMDLAYGTARAVILPALHFGMRWTVDGADRIPAHGPVILASNHTSYLDPLALAYVADRRKRRVRFLAKAELFDKRGLGGFLRAAHQIPVARGSATAAGALDDAVAALRQGECVAVFPEGTISLDLEPMRGKSGTARLARESGVAVTPVGMWGAHRLMFKGRKPRWERGVAELAVVGEPVAVGPDDDIRIATDRIMSAICGQVARARRLYPQVTDDGDDWWMRPPESAVLRPAKRIGP
jgi:1-acyl-sn-glycerol-3-phosphate acyltransferase